MMLFKSWGYMTCSHGLNFISDMKIGHYMKIPPRSMFAAQAFAVIWLSLVQVATYNFAIGHIDGICEDDQPQGLICPGAATFYNASVIWGVIGPRRVFGAGGIYAWTNCFWLIGAACPIMQYLLARRYPGSFAQYVIWPVVFGACAIVPPATLYYLFPWVIVGVIFNGWIRSRFFGWWSKYGAEKSSGRLLTIHLDQYNSVLSGALDIGSRLCVVVVAMTLGLRGKSFPSWWGTTVFTDTLDYHKKAVTRTFIPNVTEPLGPPVW
ncbi:hypothetical protein E4U43_003090 [Claviceps pusilla]|uniref:Uncharacterized protein n=1 Tax=Claviceps pusilla TaxID=123648 RepID=A0A9P7N7V8_9HYPO|nr:hypothetical protein E4U43_003090 [Claviceps pusilla]